MRRILLRTIASHLVVVLAVVIAVYAAGLQLAPVFLDGSPAGIPPFGDGSPLGDYLDLHTASVFAGLLVGAVAACVAGTIAAHRVMAPLEQLRDVTRALSEGEYEHELTADEHWELRGLVGDLNRLGQSLADVEGRRRRLLGEVAHEMRTPLTVIDGYVEGMIDGIIPVDAEELGHVTDEVRRLRRLSDDLSTLSRAEEGRLELRPLLFDLRGVVVSATERLRPQVEDAGLRMQVRPGAELVPVYVDTDRLSQVVRNLVGNAVRATPAEGTITVRVGRSGRWAWFSIRDNGEGIDPADLERIFERFYRVAGRRESRGETGSGIGLTIAREIVRAHGGELVARSRGRGSGAEFIGWLPAVA